MVVYEHQTVEIESGVERSSLGLCEVLDDPLLPLGVAKMKQWLLSEDLLWLMKKEFMHDMLTNLSRGG